MVVSSAGDAVKSPPESSENESHLEKIISDMVTLIKENTQKRKLQCVKNKIWLLAVALLVLCGCGKEAQEEVKMVILKNEGTLETRVAFVRDEKTLFSLKPKHMVGFMKFMDRRGRGPYFRATFEFAEARDYKPFLLDLTGDGDKRYLILTEWFGGNDAFGYKGYLIDTKDDFAFLGEVPAGEVYDYPLKNKDLVFTLSDSIAYFGVNGYATVSVDLKLGKGKEPQLVREEWPKFSLEPYRKMLKDKYDKPYDIALFCLYGDLASCGELSKAADYARQLGVPAKDAGAIYLDCLAAMKRSRLCKYLEQLNGMKF